MYLDEAVAKAKGECDKFLASYPHRSLSETASALEPLIKSANLVLAALNFAVSMRKDIGASITLYSFEHTFRSAGGVSGKAVTTIFLLQDGRLLKQVDETCIDGCHEFGSEQEVLEGVEDLLAQGISPTSIIKNLMEFLSDPQRDILELIPDVLN